MTKFSIIVPVYNAEYTLDKTISSVINQSYSNLELILIDDGSTDSSLEICQNYASTDSRIIVINQKNRGVSSARNFGLTVATGQWVYFLDSDDTIKHNFLKLLYEYIDEDVDVIQFGSYRYNVTNGSHSIRQTLKNDEILITNSFDKFIKISNIGSLCVWLHLIRRDLLINKDIYFSEDMKHNEDMLFMYKVLVNCRKYMFIGQTIHTQVLIPNSLSRSLMNEIKIQNRLLLIDRLLELIYVKPDFKDTLIAEANHLLKGYFGSIAYFIIQSKEDPVELYKQVEESNLIFKELYTKHRNYLKGLIPKAASLNVLYISLPLSMKIKTKQWISNNKLESSANY